MSAPERIWAGPSPVYRREEKWSWSHGDWDCDGETISYGELATEYLRADIAAARVSELVEGLRASAKAHRIIAGMDIMGASATAYNAAREAEVILTKYGDKT
jgi:heterodisulfide reductase subunit A-like polyferredoxin